MSSFNGNDNSICIPISTYKYFNHDMVDQLIKKGNSKNVSRRACMLSQSLEQALDWIEDHKQDEDFETAEVTVMGLSGAILSEEEINVQMVELEKEENALYTKAYENSPYANMMPKMPRNGQEIPTYEDNQEGVVGGHAFNPFQNMSEEDAEKMCKEFEKSGGPPEGFNYSGMGGFPGMNGPPGGMGQSGQMGGFPQGMGGSPMGMGGFPGMGGAPKKK